ncbi:MAG: type II toxin-antitoxin system VapC family toxin [Pseudonocardia sp.]|nr:type II toxin-antitoxin system VapC family toxin [Pseudonocardia sp.]
MIYFDTAALVKILRRERESDALTDWMGERDGVLLVTSTLTEVELPRALRRVEPEVLPEVPALLQRFARHEIDDSVRRAAAGFPDPVLRSLDAIHLATATVLADRGLTAFVTYDQRLLAAAVAESLPVASPGAA